MTDEQSATTEEKSAAGDEEYTTDEKEMSFLDHLEELRWNLIKGGIGLFVAVLICAYFGDWIVDFVILRPSTLTDPPLDLINTIPYGQITFYMIVILASAFVISVPWILFQMWKFIEPGLMPKERRYVGMTVGFTSLCFFAGVSFAYFIMLPYMLQFFATFGTGNIANMIAVTEYMSFVVQLVLISGLIFELPMVSYFMARLGILTPAFMKHYRRHAYVLIMIVSALITPTTDPITMGVFSIPIVFLYEFSIFIARVGVKKREAAQQESESSE